MKNFTKTIALVVFIVITNGCNKKATVKPQIKSTPASSPMTPDSGINYTAVTITGTGFDTVKTNNVVTFNGIEGIVNFAGPNRIIATVPAGATTGKVTVTTNGKTITLPNTFKVLQLVKTGEVTQPDNQLVALIFDKNNNMYGIQRASANTLVKYAGGTLSGQQTVLYKTPDDTTFADTTITLPPCCASPGGPPQSGGHPNKIYNYSLSSSMTDGGGNIYVGQTTEKDSISESPAGGYAQQGSLNSSILKITPAGSVTVLEKNITGSVSSMAMDPSGDIYFVTRYMADQTHYGHIINKMTPDGNITTFAASFANAAQDIGSMAIDNSGNLYFANNNIATDDALTITKFTPQGSGSIISGPTIYPGGDVFSWMFFDTSNNLIVASRFNILVINAANYTSYYQNPPNQDGLFADNAGNWYQPFEFNIIKYSLQ